MNRCTIRAPALALLPTRSRNCWPVPAPRHGVAPRCPWHGPRLEGPTRPLSSEQHCSRGERSWTACGSSPLGSLGRVPRCPVVGAGGARGSRGPPQPQESTATIKQLLFPPFHIFLYFQSRVVLCVTSRGRVLSLFLLVSLFPQLLILSSLETCVPSASSWLGSIRAHVVFLVTRRLFEVVQCPSELMSVLAAWPPRESEGLTGTPSRIDGNRRRAGLCLHVQAWRVGVAVVRDACVSVPGFVCECGSVWGACGCECGSAGHVCKCDSGGFWSGCPCVGGTCVCGWGGGGCGVDVGGVLVRSGAGGEWGLVTRESS